MVLERVHICEIEVYLHDINQFLDFLHIFRDFTSGNGTDYVVGSRVLEPYAEFARAIFCFEFAFRLCEKPPFGLVAFYVGYKQVAYQIYNIPSPLRKSWALAMVLS